MFHTDVFWGFFETFRFLCAVAGFIALGRFRWQTRSWYKLLEDMPEQYKLPEFVLVMWLMGSTSKCGLFLLKGWLIFRSSGFINVLLAVLAARPYGHNDGRSVYTPLQSKVKYVRWVLLIVFLLWWSLDDSESIQSSLNFSFTRPPWGWHFWF